MIIFGCSFIPVESGDGWKLESKWNGSMDILNCNQYGQHQKITRFSINIYHKMLFFFYCHILFIAKFG
jgi:hypothetical protein